MGDEFFCVGDRMKEYKELLESQAMVDEKLVTMRGLRNAIEDEIAKKLVGIRGIEKKDITVHLPLQWEGQIDLTIYWDRATRPDEFPALMSQEIQDRLEAEWTSQPKREDSFFHINVYESEWLMNGDVEEPIDNRMEMEL